MIQYFLTEKTHQKARFTVRFDGTRHSYAFGGIEYDKEKDNFFFPRITGDRRSERAMCYRALIPLVIEDVRAGRVAL